MKVAGCDLGKLSASFVILNIDENGILSIEDMEVIEHGGHPLKVFQNWFKHILKILFQNYLVS